MRPNFVQYAYRLYKIKSPLKLNLLSDHAYSRNLKKDYKPLLCLITWGLRYVHGESPITATSPGHYVLRYNRCNARRVSPIRTFSGLI